MTQTICHKFLEVKDRSSKKPAIISASNRQWYEVTWKEYYENVENIAGGLASLGVSQGDRVALFSNTRVEWAYCDLAILGIGAITVPIYQSTLDDDLEYIINDSQAKVIICEDDNLARKGRALLDRCPSLKHIIVIESNDPEDDIPPLEVIIQDGEDYVESQPEFFDSQSRTRKLSDMATIIYTSGTTGRPKGVVLTHRQIMSEVSDAFPLLGMGVRDRSLTFLPFAHILGRIEIWGHVLIGYEMVYAESIERIKFNIQSQHPTVIIAVPRIFEKIYAGIISQVEMSRTKKKVFDWAFSIGKQVLEYRSQKKTVPIPLGLQYRLAHKLVFQNIQEKMGGHLRFAVSGGAPLSKELGEFFATIGILLLEGYGLTETTAAICVNTPFDFKFGTVGKPIGDVKLRIDSDGEILVKSDKVMTEYYNNAEATKAAFTEDGYFRTGDIGEIDDEGYLKITDRKKDLIKTAGGKYVAPQKLEGLLKLNRFISQVHIHGDKKKYVVALLTLNADAVKDYMKQNQMENGTNFHQNPKIKELIRGNIAEVNRQLASFESIKNFAILPEEFTVESGELTPSLKVKRKVVDQKYNDLINELYGLDSGQAHP